MTADRPLMPAATMPCHCHRRPRRRRPSPVPAPAVMARPIIVERRRLPPSPRPSWPPRRPSPRVDGPLLAAPRRGVHREPPPSASRPSASDDGHVETRRRRLRRRPKNRWDYPHLLTDVPSPGRSLQLSADHGSWPVARRDHTRRTTP